MLVLESETIKRLEDDAAMMGVGTDKLMEQAGTKTAALAARLIAENKCKSICILCGSGNNGGDGFVIARLLSVMSSVTVILTSGEPRTTLARTNFDLLPQNVDILYYGAHYYECIGLVREADMIIDAIYGIGFHGNLSADIHDLLSFCNENRKAVKIAADLPSGIECDTGKAADGCFRADYTVTFTALKPLHVLLPSSDLCGEVTVENVGIPQRLLNRCPYAMKTTDQYAAENPFPIRAKSAHKGDNGTLLAVCGSYGMAGAALLSAEAALRTGVGLLKLALPESIYPIAAGALREPVYLPLAQSKDGIVDIDEYAKLLQQMQEGSDAALIGCGLGQNKSIKSLVPLLVDAASKPLVLDADGINALGANINVLKRSAAPIILTPHPGEMARLLGTTVQTVQSDRYHIARRFAKEYGVTLVLKGANTLIATPAEKVYVNMTGNNGMGKGGSGDVLAGMCASFLAQGMSTEQAAVCAVYYHGLAGDRCAEKYSSRAMLPGDMIEALKTIF